MNSSLQARKEIKKNARQSSKQERREEGCHQAKASWREEEEKKDPQGELFHLHLQGVEAGSSRDWYLQQSHEHHELLC